MFVYTQTPCMLQNIVIVVFLTAISIRIGLLKICDIWSSHGGVDKDSSLLGC